MPRFLGYLAILMVLVAGGAFAAEQEDETVSSSFEEFPEPWLVEGLVEAPLYSFYLGAPDLKGMAYFPNFSPKVGPRIYYRGAGVTATFALPSIDNYRRGESVANSFIFTPHTRQMGFDFYYQSYKGFYVDSPLSEVTFNEPDRFAQLPDAVVTNMGANAYYVLRPEQYSLAAAFNQAEFQKESGGSFLVNPFVNRFSLTTGRTFIRGTDPDSIPGLPIVDSGTFTTLGLGAGYGYAWIVGRRFMAIQGTLGVGPQYQQVLNKDNESSESVGVAFKGNANLSGGYNWRTYVLGSKLLVDSLQSKVNTVQLNSSMIAFQVYFGGRF